MVLMSHATALFYVHCMKVIVWWWWPSSAGKGFLSFHPCALIKSLNENGMKLLLDDIPEEQKKKWGERGSLLLQQLFGGASIILMNKNGEALAMDTIWTIGSSSKKDTAFVRSRGIDTSKHTYPFKCRVIPLSRLIYGNCDVRQPIVAASLPYSLFFTVWQAMFEMILLKEGLMGVSGSAGTTPLTDLQRFKIFSKILIAKLIYYCILNRSAIQEGAGEPKGAYW